MVIGTLGLGLAQKSSATQTWLALRAGCVMPIYGGVTVQTISTNYGTNTLVLPFSGTNASYDFYSPPLSQAVALTTTDKGGGIVYMQNTGTTTANNFAVTGRMHYYDYDPNTGVDVSIVDTGVSAFKNVNAGQTVNWGLANVALPANYTLAVGHMIHVRLTLALYSGNAGNWGFLVYNGPNKAATSAYFPQNRSTPVYWQFNSSVVYGTAAKMLGLTCQSGGKMCISCAGSASATYWIQATTNLQSGVWTTIGSTNSDSNGLFSFVDAHAGNYSSCFYRAVTAAQ